MLKTLHDLREVRGELGSGSMGGTANSSDDNGAGLALGMVEHVHQLLHQDGEVLENVLAETLQDGIQSIASLLGDLRGGLVHQVEDEGQESGVVLSNLLVKFLGKGAKSHASSATNVGLGILETGADDQKKVTELGANEINRALDQDSQGNHGGLAVQRIRVLHVGEDTLEGNREDLLGREVSGESVDDLEGKTSRRVLVAVLRLLLGSNGHEGLDHGGDQLETLDLGLLVDDGPHKEGKSLNTHDGLVGLVTTNAEEELDQVLDMLGENGDLEQQEGIKDIEALGSRLLVAVVEALLKDVDHMGDELREHGNLILLVLVNEISHLAQSLDGGGADDLRLGIDNSTAEQLQELAKVLSKGIGDLEDGVDEVDTGLAMTSVGAGRALEQEGEELVPGVFGNFDSSNSGNDTSS